MNETFMGHWAGPNGCRLLSEFKGKTLTLHTQQVPLLNCVLFWLLFRFIDLCLELDRLSNDDLCLLSSRLAFEIYSGGGPSMYICCVACYQVIAAPYVRSISCLHTSIGRSYYLMEQHR